MAQLVSINAGTARPLGPKDKLTGIFKQPLGREVEIGPLGIAGDAIIDRKHHGGPDQALYLYLQSDYDWWAAELGQALAPGTFGENLTISGLESEQLSVGDRLRLGSVLLEITSHREPCNTFAMRMGDAGWVRRFHRARRPGAYCRVLETGFIAPGMAVEHLPYAGETVRLGELVDTDGNRAPDPALLRRAIAAPLHFKLKAKFEALLAGGA
jgi:MOSC domain-containing protein YiiM